MSMIKNKITKRKNGTRRVQSFNSEPSLTKQSFKDDCSVYSILDKHKRTGMMRVNSGTARYGELDSQIDYLDAMNAVIQAQDQFDNLPAALRKKFSNDPAEFLEFCSKEENFDKMVKMGIKDAPAEQPTLTPSPEQTKGSEAQTSLKETDSTKES